MKSREEEFAGKVGVHLDRAVADLRPGLAYRLQQARGQALARLAGSEREAAAGGLVGAQGLVGAGAGGANLPAGTSRPVVTPVRLGLAAAMLALAMLGWQQWRAWQELAELEDIDTRILSSDLPIDAFVDRGFQQFLEVAPTLVPADEQPAEGEAPAAEESVDETPATPSHDPYASPANPAQ